MSCRATPLAKWSRGSSPGSKLAGVYAVLLAFLVTAGWNANHFASVLVLLQEHQNLSSVLVTGAYGIYALGLFPSLLIGGYVADRVGSKPAVVAGALIAAAGNALLMLLHTGAWLLAGRLVVGFGVGLVVSAGTAWAGRLRGAGGTTAAGIALTFGFMLGPVGSGIVAHLAGGQTWAVRLAFLVPVVMAISVVAVSLWRGEGAALNPPPAEPSATAAQSERKALATAVPMGLWVFASITTAMVSLAGRTEFGIDAFMPGVAAVIGFSAALTAQAVGRRQGWGPGAGVAGAVCAAVGMALVGVGGAEPGWAAFVLATLFLGLGYGLCLREGLLDVNTFSPPASRGRVIGLYYVATYIGFGLPPLIAWLTPRVGASWPFVVVSSLAVASAAIRARQIRSGYLVRG